ncbi:MAG: hypothetical protein HY507_00080 [Candidatus Zambryskibacteria bacterium]|nr:hypothetical protein [Candidatus Zambryskibacteria bacterium]
MQRLYSRWIIWLIVSVFFLFQFAIPAKFPAIGAGLSAGFAPNSVWISKSNVAGGESVNIFAVLYNSSEESLTGELLFLIDDSVIGLKNFTLAVGQTKIESFPWTAEQGKHKVSAKIEKVWNTGANTNATIALLNQTTGSITVLILPPLPPPPPSKTAEALKTAVSTLKTALSSSTPVVANALESLYNTTESIRKYAKSALEKQPEKQATESVKSNANTKNTATKADSPKTVDGEPEDNFGFLKTAQNQTAAVILAVVSSKPLFYIALGLSFLFLFILLRTFIKARRRKL